MEETLAVETGFSDGNFWLEWMKYTASQVNRSGCITCSTARPHLGTVPLHLDPNHYSCFIGLYVNQTINETVCNFWKGKFPILSEAPSPGGGITIYKGNYTCFEIEGSEGKHLGRFPKGYCGTVVNTTGTDYQTH